MSHVLVLGATGHTGIIFCTAALEAGHELTLYLRNPSKLPSSITKNAKVIVIEGALEDDAGLQRAVSTGATIFVSFAGPTYGSKGTPVTNCMKRVFPLLIEHKFKRALVLGTCSYPTAEDKGALKWKASVVLIKIIGGDAFREFHGLGQFVASQDLEQIKWTLFRVGFLGNGPAKHVEATHTGSGRDGMTLSRKSIVAWVLQEFGTDSVFIGKTPVLCN